MILKRVKVKSTRRERERENKNAKKNNSEWNRKNAIINRRRGSDRIIRIKNVKIVNNLNMSNIIG